MAIKILESRDGFTPQTGYDEAIFFDEKGKFYRMSKVNSSLEYWRHGKYPTKVYFEWCNWKCQAISQLLSFNPIVGYTHNRFYRAEHPEYDYGSFKFQLSNDNGTKYYYWDSVGGDWAECSDPSDEDQWNTAEEIDEHIATFPLIYNPTDETVQIRPRVLMFSGGKINGSSHDRSITPFIKDIDFVVRYDYDTIMDLLASVKTFVENNFTGRFLVRHQMEADDSEFDVNTDFTNLVGMAVFNLTTDPNRETNIFDSVAGNTVTLTGAVSEDDVLEFIFSGTCPVVVQEDPELVDAQIPTIVVRSVDKETERNMGSLEGVYILPKISSDFSYVGKEARWSNSMLRLACVSANEGTAVNMSSAVSALFENHRVIQSLATGDYFYIMDIKPYQDANDIGKASNKKLLVAELLYQDWARDGQAESIEEITNITEIHVNMEVLGQSKLGPELSTEEDVQSYG